MRTKTREFIQHLAHDFDDADDDALEPFLDDVMPAIGLVVVHFNMLEKELDSLICSYISDRSDALGLVVIHGLMYGAKVKLFQRLCEARNAALPHVPASYAGLVDELEEVGRQRNLVVHADWTSTDAQGYTYHRLKITKGRMRQEYVQLTPSAIEPIVDAIISVKLRLGTYWEEADEALRRA